jgi:hypothetical protein
MLIERTLVTNTHRSFLSRVKVDTAAIKRLANVAKARTIFTNLTKPGFVSSSDVRICLK